MNHIRSCGFEDVVSFCGSTEGKLLCLGMTVYSTDKKWSVMSNNPEIDCPHCIADYERDGKKWKCYTPEDVNELIRKKHGVIVR